MHRNQLSAKSGCPPARPRHGRRDVVEFEIEEHPQALVSQLSHHIRPSLDKELKTYLHPAQTVHLLAQRQGLIRRHAIESHDDLLR